MTNAGYRRKRGALDGVSVLVSGRELKWAHCAAVWHWGSRRPLKYLDRLDVKI